MLFHLGPIDGSSDPPNQSISLFISWKNRTLPTLSDQPPGGGGRPGQGPPAPIALCITCRVMVLRPLVTACSRTPSAWRVRNMRLRCQGWEMGSERPCQATRLLPRKRCGLAISGEVDKGRLRGGAAKCLRRYDAWWRVPGRQGAASLSAHSLVGPALQTIYLPWARPALCLGLPVTGPFVSCATLSGLCPDMLFHPQPSLAGRCPVPAPARVPSMADSSRTSASPPTLGTALAPKAQRTFAAERVPLVHTGPPVGASVAVTHVLLGRAA